MWIALLSFYLATSIPSFTFFFTSFAFLTAHVYRDELFRVVTLPPLFLVRAQRGACSSAARRPTCQPNGQRAPWQRGEQRTIKLSRRQSNTLPLHTLAKKNLCACAPSRAAVLEAAALATGAAATGRVLRRQKDGKTNGRQREKTAFSETDTRSRARLRSAVAQGPGSGLQSRTPAQCSPKQGRL